MIVAVVGASGGVGSATVKAALAAGLRVRAFARSRQKLSAALGEGVIDQLDAHVLEISLTPTRWTHSSVVKRRRGRSGSGAIIKELQNKTT